MYANTKTRIHREVNSAKMRIKPHIFWPINQQQVVYNRNDAVRTQAPVHRVASAVGERFTPGDSWGSLSSSSDVLCAVLREGL